MSETISSGKHESLAAALLAIQREIPPVEPDAVNPHFKSKFVSLGHLISKVRPILNAHGVSFQQFPTTIEVGAPALATVLRHESGESEVFTAPLMLTKPDPQAQGSAITYMRRYALAAALGVCDQEDDDGNGATPSVSGTTSSWAISDKQKAFLERLLKQNGVKGQDLLLLIDWAGKVLTGGKAGSASEAIDGLQNDPDLTLKRLLEAARKWDEKQSAMPADTTDLPEAE